MFKDARKVAGLSRETAAGYLHIGVRTLADYEAGATLTPPDVALRMEEVYIQPKLSARYCKEYCPIGQKHADSVEDTDFATAVLGLIKEHNHVGKLLNQLIEIAADGDIGDDEAEEYRVIDRELTELKQKITTLKLCTEIISRDKEKTALAAVM